MVLRLHFVALLLAALINSALSQQISSNTSNSTTPVIISMKSPLCLSVPGHPNMLVNCTTTSNDQSYVDFVPVEMVARNVFNESFSIQSAADDGTSPLDWGMEYVWTFELPSDQHQSLPQPVHIQVNVSTIPSFLRIKDHKEHSSHTNVTVWVNECDSDQQVYFVDFPGGPYHIVRCRTCPIGSVLDPNDQTKCDVCPKETYYSGNECVQCAANTFQPNTSSLACYTCSDRPDMEECRIGDIPLAITVIAALASPLVTLAIIMCVVRQRSLGRCLCKRGTAPKIGHIDFDDMHAEFLHHDSQSNFDHQDDAESDFDYQEGSEFDYRGDSESNYNYHEQRL